MVDGVADAQEVEDLEGDKAFEGLGAVRAVLFEAAAVAELARMVVTERVSTDGANTAG